MEINQIKYTDLTILRKILEGEFDTNLDNCNGFNDEQQKLKRIKNNSKRKSFKEINTDFYLNENDEDLKLWLKKKNKLSRLKRKEMKKEKQEEKLKNEEERRKIEERLTLARVAYDNWLKEIRKTPVRISKNIRSESRKQGRKKVADDCYNEWLTKKQKIKPKIVKETILNENQKSEKKLLREDKKSNLQIVPVLIDNSPSIIPPTTSKGILSSHRSKSSKLQTEPEKIDEDFQKIIADLHRTKAKQTELSKKRVDSGIIFHREKKSSNKNLLVKSNDSFQWKLVEEENGEVIEEGGDFKSNSRTRKVDQITHEHENPFIDKSLENYFLNKFLQT